MTVPSFEVEIRRVGGSRTTRRVYTVSDPEPGVREVQEVKKGHPTTKRTTKATDLPPLDFDEALREVAELAGVIQDDPL